MAERFDAIQDREKGLRQGPTSAQPSMTAIGGAIGNGLFLGSSFAIDFAGPSAIISYAMGALVALSLMGCLAEMTVAHRPPAHRCHGRISLVDMLADVPRFNKV